MPSRVEPAAFLIGLAAALYVLAAWAVTPGFYDGIGQPQYDYVNPPPFDVAVNTAPTSGTGSVAVGAQGFVATRDQPIAQAGILFDAGSLAAPAGGYDVRISITPSDVAHDVPGVTLAGNAYCITATSALNPGRSAVVSLMWPADQPVPTAMYRAASLGGTWTSIGGQLDYSTFVVTASTSELGCFAVGYPTPKPGGSPRLGGSALPIVTAAAILIVILAGLPLAMRRRRRPGAHPEQE